VKVITRAGEAAGEQYVGRGEVLRGADGEGQTPSRALPRPLNPTPRPTSPPKPYPALRSFAERGSSLVIGNGALFRVETYTLAFDKRVAELIESAESDVPTALDFDLFAERLLAKAIICRGPAGCGLRCQGSRMRCTSGDTRTE
jgi:hypothetical protein